MPRLLEIYPHLHCQLFPAVTNRVLLFSPITQLRNLLLEVHALNAHAFFGPPLYTFKVLLFSPITHLLDLLKAFVTMTNLTLAFATLAGCCCSVP